MGALQSFNDWPTVPENSRANVGMVAITHNEDISLDTIKADASTSVSDPKTFKGDLSALKKTGIETEGYAKVTMVVFHKQGLGADGNVVDLQP
jgi:hypothetical protein